MSFLRDRQAEPQLPPGDTCSPPWTAADDVELGDSMILHWDTLSVMAGTTTTFNVPGLEHKKLPDNTHMFLQEVAHAVSSSTRLGEVKREPADIRCRLFELRKAFGNSHDAFKTFEKIAHREAKSVMERVVTASTASSKGGRFREASSASERVVMASACPSKGVTPCKRTRSGRQREAAPVHKAADKHAGSDMARIADREARSKERVATGTVSHSKGAAPHKRTRSGRGRESALIPKVADKNMDSEPGDGNAVNSSAQKKSPTQRINSVQKNGSAQRSSSAERGHATGQCPRRPTVSAAVVTDRMCTTATKECTPGTTARTVRAEQQLGALASVAPQLVERCRGALLRRLNLPPPHGDEEDKGEAKATDMHSTLHTELRTQLSSQLCRTALGAENSSILLLGPRGCGRHRLLQSSLAQLRSPCTGDAVGGASSKQHDYICVHLHPLLIADEASALKVIAAQLELTREIEAAKVGSFCDGLRFVLHLLRRARPGAQGEARREAQAQPVCFIIHEFEQFALRSKQTLLYSLFDLVQTDEAHMAVVGISTRVDALDLLEKRVHACKRKCGDIAGSQAPQ